MARDLNNVWAGWEYENDIGTHMVVSKRHYFKHGRPVCGTRLNRYFAPHIHEGWDCCNRCYEWALKHDVDVN